MRKTLLISCLLLLLHTLLQAHESRPLYLKIQLDSTQTELELSVPNTVNAKNLPLIYLNDQLLNQDAQWTAYSSGFRQRWRINDRHISIKGSILRIEFPVFNPVLSSIVAISFPDGTEQMLIKGPDEGYLTIPRDASVQEVRYQFSWLGIEHIWAGIDHLLFLICLMIISGFTRQLLFAVSGFTLAHSLTLILSTLDVLRLPVPLIESIIALSIVFLCYEIIHHHQDKDSLTYRYPIIAASLFGLLHGMGFAAVLREIALPQHHLISSLLFFNVGVELGQVMFIALVVAIVFLLDAVLRAVISVPVRAKLISLGLRTAIYMVGILASFWMFERII